jgi:hypothetical protein
LIDVRYIQVFSDSHILFNLGIGKDPSCEPFDIKNASTIICPGGVLYETYPFQVAERMRVAF